MAKAVSCAFLLNLTFGEFAKLQLREAFLISQPTLTRAVKAIFVSKYGESYWLEAFKSNLGSRMQNFVIDDGRPFDM
jgi:hypothetical protein